MAKKSRSYSSTPSRYVSKQRSVRDAVAIANRPLLQLIRPLRLFTPILVPKFEDRRTFHPDGPFRLPAARFRSATQLVIKNVNKSPVAPSRTWPSASVGFRRPDAVDLCVKRKTRREIIFARGIAGTRVRRGRFNHKSGFHCS